MISIIKKTLNIINESDVNENVKINIYLIILNIIYYSLLKDLEKIIFYKICKEIEKMILILNEIDNLDEIFELKIYFHINKNNKNIMKEFTKCINKYEGFNDKILILKKIKELKRIILKNKLWHPKIRTSILF